MNLVGRYTRVRGLRVASGSYGPPMIIDRGRAQESPRLLPYERSPEWWRSPSGLWVETQKILASERGAVGYHGTEGAYWPSFGFPQGDTTIVLGSTNLNSAYTAGSAGAATAAHSFLPNAKTLNHIYFYIKSFTGTASAVDDLNYEVRANASGNLPDTTGTLASGSVNPSSNTGWIRANSSAISLALSARTSYHTIIGDADGGATNFAVLARADGANYASVGTWFQLHQGYTTSNGWTSRSALSELSSIVLVMSDGTVFGNVFTVQNVGTSDSNQKGLYVAGFQTKKSVYAMVNDVTLTNVTNVRIWEGSAGPSGSGYKDTGTAAIASGGNNVGYFFSTTVTLSALTAYRFVFAGSGSNFTAPRKRQIGTVVTTVNSGAASDLSPGMPGGGGWYTTVENAGSWADTTTEVPQLTIYEDDDVATASGGGGAGAGSGLGAVLLG